MSVEMNPTTGLRVDLLGPTVEFLTSPQEASIDFCVLRGVSRPASQFRFTATLTRRTFLSSPATPEGNAAVGIRFSQGTGDGSA